MGNPKTVKGWTKKIRAACIAAGTYQPYFDAPIQALAEILVQRDAAERQYKESGSQPVVAYTNKGGASNPTRNPMLVLWMDLSSAALSYYKELGLTPGGRTKLGLPPDPSTATGPKDPLFGD